MGIGARIKELLRQKGKTITWLSKESGVSINSLYTITKRDDTTIKKENLEKISKTLGCDPVFLLTGYESTTEYYETGSSESGLLAILADMYGYAELKSVQGKHAETCYFLIGDEDKENLFILYEPDIEAILKMVMNSIEPIVERLKDVRTQVDVVTEILNELSDPELKKMFEDKFENLIQNLPDRRQNDDSPKMDTPTNHQIDE